MLLSALYDFSCGLEQRPTAHHRPIVQPTSDPIVHSRVAGLCLFMRTQAATGRAASWRPESGVRMSW